MNPQQARRPATPASAQPPDLFPTLTNFSFSEPVANAIRRSGANPRELQQRFERAHAAGDTATKNQLAERLAGFIDTVQGGSAGRMLLDEHRIPSPDDPQPTQNSVGGKQAFFGSIFNGLSELVEAVPKLTVAAGGLSGALTDPEWRRANKSIDETFAGLKTYVSDNYRGNLASYNDQTGEVDLDMSVDNMIGTAGNLISYILPGVFTMGASSLASGGARAALRGAVTTAERTAAGAVLTRNAGIATRLTGASAFLQTFPGYQREAMQAGYSMQDATLFAVPVAAVNAVIETANMGALAKAMGVAPQTAKSALRKATLEQATQTLLKSEGKLSADMLVDTAQQLAKDSLELIRQPGKLNAWSKLAGRIGRGIVEQGGPEGGEEVLQSIVENGAKDIMRNVQDHDATGHFEDPTIGRYIFDALYGGMLGAVVGSIPGVAFQERQLDPTLFGYVGANVRKGLRDGTDIADLLDPTAPGKLKLFGMLDHKRDAGEIDEQTHALLSQKVRRMAEVAAEFADVDTSFAESDKFTLFAVSEARHTLGEQQAIIGTKKTELEALLAEMQNPQATIPERIKAEIAANEATKGLGGLVETPDGPRYAAELALQQRQAQTEGVVQQVLARIAHDENRQDVSAWALDSLSAIDNEFGEPTYEDSFKPSRTLTDPDTGTKLVTGPSGRTFRPVVQTGGELQQPARLNEQGQYVPGQYTPLEERYDTPLAELDSHVRLAQHVAAKTAGYETKRYVRPDNSAEANLLRDGVQLVADLETISGGRKGGKKTALAQTKALVGPYLAAGASLIDTPYGESFAEIARKLQPYLTDQLDESMAEPAGGDMPLMDEQGAEPISDAEYIQFIDSGFVSPERLDRLADLVTSRSRELSPREAALLADNAAAIKERIASPEVVRTAAGAGPSFYAGSVDLGDGFSRSGLREAADERSIYEITPTGPDTAEYRLRPEAAALALSDPYLYLQQGATYPVDQLASARTITTTRPGTLALQGDKWIIQQKASLQFNQAPTDGAAPTTQTSSPRAVPALDPLASVEQTGYATELQRTLELRQQYAAGEQLQAAAERAEQLAAAPLGDDPGAAQRLLDAITAANDQLDGQFGEDGAQSASESVDQSIPDPIGAPARVRNRRPTFAEKYVPTDFRGSALRYFALRGKLNQRDFDRQADANAREGGEGGNLYFNYLDAANGQPPLDKLATQLWLDAGRELETRPDDAEQQLVDLVQEFRPGNTPSTLLIDYADETKRQRAEFEQVLNTLDGEAIAAWEAEGGDWQAATEAVYELQAGYSDAQVRTLLSALRYHGYQQSDGQFDISRLLDDAPAIRSGLLDIKPVDLALFDEFITDFDAFPNRLARFYELARTYPAPAADQSAARSRPLSEADRAAAVDERGYPASWDPAAASESTTSGQTGDAVESAIEGLEAAAGRTGQLDLGLETAAAQPITSAAIGGQATTLLEQIDEAIASEAVVDSRTAEVTAPFDIEVASLQREIEAVDRTIARLEDENRDRLQTGDLFAADPVAATQSDLFAGDTTGLEAEAAARQAIEGAKQQRAALEERKKTAQANKLRAIEQAVTAITDATSPVGPSVAENGSTVTENNNSVPQNPDSDSLSAQTDTPAPETDAFGQVDATELTRGFSARKRLTKEQLRDLNQALKKRGADKQLLANGVKKVVRFGALTLDYTHPQPKVYLANKPLAAVKGVTHQVYGEDHSWLPEFIPQLLYQYDQLSQVSVPPAKPALESIPAAFQLDTTPQQESAPPPAQPDRLAPLAGLLSRATGVAVVSDPAEFARVAQEAAQAASNRSGVGVDPARLKALRWRGKVYLSPRADAGSLWHEFGGLWAEAARQKQRDLYDRGVKLVRQSGYFSRLNQNEYYRSLPVGEREIEALEQAIGDKGAQFRTASYRDGFGAWLKELAARVGNWLGIVSDESLIDARLDRWAAAAMRQIEAGSLAAPDRMDQPRFQQNPMAGRPDPATSTLEPPVPAGEPVLGERPFRPMERRDQAEAYLKNPLVQGVQLAGQGLRAPYASPDVWSRAPGTYTAADNAFINAVANATGWRLTAPETLTFERSQEQYHLAGGSVVELSAAKLATMLENGVGQLFIDTGYRGYLTRFVADWLPSWTNLTTFSNLLDDGLGTLKKLIEDVQLDGARRAGIAKTRLQDKRLTAERLMAPFVDQTLRVNSYDYDRGGNVVLVEKELPLLTVMEAVALGETQMGSTKNGGASHVFDTTPAPNELYDVESDGSFRRKLDHGGQFYDATNDREDTLLLPRAEFDRLLDRLVDGVDATSGEVDAYEALIDFFNQRIVTDLLETEDGILNPGKGFVREGERTGGVSMRKQRDGQNPADEPPIDQSLTPTTQDYLRDMRERRAKRRAKRMEQIGDRQTHYYPIRTTGRDANARSEAEGRVRLFDKSGRLITRAGEAKGIVLGNPLQTMLRYEQQVGDLLEYGRLQANLMNLRDAVANKYSGPRKTQLTKFLKKRYEDLSSYRERMVAWRNDHPGLAGLERQVRRYTTSVFALNLGLPAKQLGAALAPLGQGIIGDTYLKDPRALSLLAKLTAGAYRDAGVAATVRANGSDEGLRGGLFSETDTVERPYVDQLLGNGLDEQAQLKQQARFGAVINRLLDSHSQYVGDVTFDQLGFNQATLTAAQKKLQQYDAFAGERLLSAMKRADRAPLLYYVKAAQLQASAEGLSENSDAWWDRVADLSEQVMSRTYNTDSLAEKTPMQLSEDFFTRMIGMYSSQQQKVANLVVRSLINYAKAEPGSDAALDARARLLKAVGYGVISNAVYVSAVSAGTSVIMALLSGNAPDDTDKLIGRVESGAISNVVNLFPGLGSLAADYVIGMNDSIRGNEDMVEIIPLEQMQTGIDALQAAGTYMTEEDEKKSDQAADTFVRRSTDWISKSIGLPSVAVKVIRERLTD